MADAPTNTGFEWIVARTQANLYFNGAYTGIQVSLRTCRPDDAVLAKMNLPPLPKKGG